MKKVLFLISFLFLIVLAKGQEDDGRMHIDSAYAAELLSRAVQGTEYHNLISDGRVLIDSEERAIELAEFYLFEIYGRDQIIAQSPYDVFHIDHRWIISGTWDGPGGTFLIIFDDITGYVLQITHGK